MGIPSWGFHSGDSIVGIRDFFRRGFIAKLHREVRLHCDVGTGLVLAPRISNSMPERWMASCLPFEEMVHAALFPV